ncbi:Sugar phosphate isomerase/epimerase [Caldanaerobius fijiensis DSM 17918]|uniref:Sugar phosphate isomerase/epimerase n=1 Tax=Caldanaerobius fijiensis DSM 17918 TaxID=1121256 RepID=A0A1M4W2F1_9THEO|nr:sugar phosphate isomerase/epimerase [Caldanaerobius fijiensis]SHE75335.1 Sugar phosphate isomerase/epimerase [Caldanaerobius fijiensis DSM 17918]
MKLGIIGFPTEDSIKATSQLGLKYIEFCMNTKPEELYDRVDEIKSYLDKYGVNVSAIGRWGVDKYTADKKLIDEELQISYNLIDAASKLGCTVFNTGCNYVESLSYYENCTLAIEFLSKLIEYGKSRGVRIATYNCHWNNFIVNDMAWTLIHGYLKDLGIKYDPSHARYAGYDYLSEIQKWGHRFYHMHIKGSLIVDGKRVDDPPAGLDQTDWPSIFAILYAKGYDGVLSIEPHSSVWIGELGEKGIKYTINYIRKLMLE